MTDSTETADQDGRNDLLAEAIRVLTAAARRTRPVLERDDAASEAAGHPVWVESDKREPADWAEFVTLALAGAAANVGGISAVLAGRPGSWEAYGVRQLLASTVGEDGEFLHEHRTEPLVITVYVDEALYERGLWMAYDDAQTELTRRNMAVPEPADGAPDPEWDEQDRQIGVLADLEEQLEEQRKRDWAAYGEAVKAHILAAAADRSDLRVPVEVTLELDDLRPDHVRPTDYYEPGLAWDLMSAAVAEVPMPGGGQPPLERLVAGLNGELRQAAEAMLSTPVPDPAPLDPPATAATDEGDRDDTGGDA
jgi:hypothetical protein